MATTETEKKAGSGIKGQAVLSTGLVLTSLILPSSPKSMRPDDYAPARPLFWVPPPGTLSLFFRPRTSNCFSSL